MDAELLTPPVDPPPAYALPPKIEMTREEFERWDPEPTGIKYEWKNGRVIFGENSMNQTERHILTNVMDAFSLTDAYANGGRLFPETNCFLPPDGAMRRPDLAFFTRAQIRESQQELDPVPAFVVEVVSKHDKYNYHDDKLDDYLAAGVQVIWHIVPHTRRSEGGS